jgi:hypothetical protein
MTWVLFVLINQAKYYAQDTGNQYSIENIAIKKLNERKNEKHA